MQATCFHHVEQQALPKRRTPRRELNAQCSKPAFHAWRCSYSSHVGGVQRCDPTKNMDFEQKQLEDIADRTRHPQQIHYKVPHIESDSQLLASAKLSSQPPGAGVYSDAPARERGGAVHHSASVLSWLGYRSPRPRKCDRRPHASYLIHSQCVSCLLLWQLRAPQ